MIETTQSVPVNTAIGTTWEYVRDIRRWAELMPGLQDCEIIDDDNSRWVLKVGVGALVRTVKVLVHVEEWAGPERARFSFKLQGDPVTGGGSYEATATGSDAMEMTLSLRVEGTGPMAPMWEAMGAPLLPKFAMAFARQLAEGVEAWATPQADVPASQPHEPADPQVSLLRRFRNWLASWRRGYHARAAQAGESH